MSASGGPAPARACAASVIKRVFDGGAYADRAFHSEAANLDGRDRQLALALAYGTVQRRLTLDHLIEAFSDRSVETLDPAVRCALRMGLFELLYMHGAPDRAVVHDAVELARGAGSKGHGFVNAVLRRATREGQKLLDGLGDGTPEQAAIAHSHPRWIAERWFAGLGAEDARMLMAADNQPASTTLRVNTLTATVEQVTTELGLHAGEDPLLPEALALKGPFDAHNSPLWQSGAIIAQSRASMLVARALDPKPGERVLDLCAGPGGKSTHLAALMADEGEIVAVERDRRRAGTLARNAQRLHANCIRVEVADASTQRDPADTFQRVLVDPPCTGLGTLQSHPDLRWRVQPEDPERISAIQEAILDAGAQALRPGGVLVYSTCTICAEENERLIARFLERNRDFHVDDLAAHMPALRHPHPDAREFLLTLPHRDRTQGFFIARLHRSA